MLLAMTTVHLDGFRNEIVIDLRQDEFIPVLDYPPELRKITKNRGHFPDKDAAMKLLHLGLRNISRQRGGNSGTGTHGGKVALNTLIEILTGRILF